MVAGNPHSYSGLRKNLREQGIPLVVTSEPGGTKIGQAIRKILLNVDNTDIAYLTELFYI